MAAEEAISLPSHPPDATGVLRQLQKDAILLVLPPLCLASFILILSEGEFPDHLRVAWPGVALFLLPAAVLGLRRLSYLASAWTLVGGCLAVVLLIVGWGHLWAALYLFALPAALATLFVSTAGGISVAVASSVLLLFAPASLLPADRALGVVTAIGMWSTVGLIWLTQRPLLTAVEWSWSSYDQSRSLLERARDYQVQLKQTLADLAEANSQLTRLNRLAQGLRQAAEDARRASEQFVANVSHELRTPLNMIIGFSEMILQTPEAYGANLPGSLLADLAVIHRNSQHLSSLIDDVLDLSQIRAGQVALTKERVDLRGIVEAALVAVRPLFESKGLELTAEVPHGLVVMCDRTRMREVLLNLLSNAGRFTDHGGARVRAWRDGNDVVASVSDTGPGIAAEDLDKIFQPFRQLDGTIRRRHGGSGLGLAISKSFVQLHGGDMWLESEKGRGTTFFFRLPVDPPAAGEGSIARWFNPNWHYEERTHRSLASSSCTRPRLVVLESGDPLQRLLSRYLDGAEVVPVASLSEAAQELARTPARALVINEASIPEALQHLSGSAVLPNGTPAVICSVPGMQEAAGALGAAGYLIKPIARDTLLEALDRLSLSGRTVLIVDDEPEALRLFRRMLVSSGRGYRVLLAGDGIQALHLLREQHPDVVLLDLVMPEMDGFRFLAVTKEDPDLRDIPVVVISARDPAGQPIISSAIAATREGGLSVPQLLACIDALTRILATAGQGADPAPPAAHPG